MTLLNLGYLPFVVGAIALFWFFSTRVEAKYFQWILDHWFYKRSVASKISGVMYFIGFALLFLALLDLRGPERRMSGKASDQKTIILIDASASMLVEDVRPNRFEKAVLLAKHFIKKSVGHQVSVVVFSDGQKRIVPFTNDKDLVEARLDTVENLDLERGGTGLSLAVQESIQYFINNEQRPFGNILVITDAEETDGGFDLEIPEGISVAVIGVGTAKGGPIPMRSARGVFKGNKKHNGETVISRLDDNFLKSLGDKIEHYKYWVASSYTIPTEEVLRFFDRSLKVKESKQDFRVRPVLANYLLVPGIIAMIVAFLLKNMRSFALCLALFISFNSFPREAEEKEPEKSPLVVELEKRFARNELDADGKKKLAAELLKGGFPEQAKNLYEEILPSSPAEASLEERFNLGAAQFKSKDITGGMKTYGELMDYLESNPSPENNELLAKAKRNVLKAIQVDNQQKKKEQEKKKSQEKDQKKDEQKKDDKGEQGEKGESGDEQDSPKKPGEQGKKDKEDKKGKDKDSKGDKDQGEEKSDQKKKKPRDKKQNNTGGAGEKKDKQKMPSILKQLMNDDDQLQKKVIDADTVKRKSRDKKDW